jgi:tetratricopeptide (TPR) repeat protein
MRLAVVVAPSYERATAATRRMARLAEVLADRLAEPDAGFRVEVLEARGRVGDRLASVLSSRTSEGPVLVVISGEILLDDIDEPFLRLSGESMLSLSELRSTLTGAADETLLVVDAGHAPDEDDAAASVTLVAAIRDAVEPKASGISLMVGARPLDEERRGPSTFISGVLASLEKCAGTLRKTGRVEASRVYETLRADEDRFHRIPAAGWFPGRLPFPILLQPSIVIGGSDSMPPSVRPSTRPPAGSPVSIPPTEVAPAADEAWRAGNEAARAERYQEAIDSYKRALLLLGKKPERAELYFRIGRAKAALGSESEAVLNYDKALGVEPLHHDAFERAVKILKKQQDFAGVERLLQRRFDARTDDAARTRELAAIARLWIDEAKSPKQAVTALERWLGLREDPDALDLLVTALTDAARHAAANDARKRLAALLEEHPARRARLLLAAARTAAEHLPRGGDAVALARSALEADPTALEALEVAASILVKKRNWSELAELYELLLENTDDPMLAWDLAKKLGQLYRDELDDLEGAKRSFGIAVERKPEDVELRFALYELELAEQNHDAAADQMRRAAEQASDQPEIFRRALWCFEKTNETDAAWNAACVLDEMGEADINESLLADTHRPEGLLSARGVLTEADWRLLRPERDETLERVLAEIAPAAVAVRLRDLERGGRAPKLADATRQNLAGTTTLVRSMVWTARLVAIPPPELHVLSEVDGEISPLPMAEPTAAASKTVTSGLDLAELAFLWGRVLSYFQDGHRLLVHYPALTDVAKLLLAALAIANDEEPDEGLRPLAEALEEELGAAALKRLAKSAKAFRKKAARRRVERFVASVHACATRVGLLACGDIARAVSLVGRFPLRGDIPAERQIADLRSFAISREYASLRERIGVSVR